MKNWIEIRKSFEFLNEYNFYGPIIYPNGVEVNFDYFSKNAIINITYEPGREFLTKLIRLKTDFTEMEPEKIRWRNLKTSEYKIYDIGLFLDLKKRIKNSIQGKNQGDKNIVYYSGLLKTNFKVLENDFSDFSVWSLILKCLN